LEGGTCTIGNSQIEARFAITAADGLVLETFTDLRTGRALNSAAADAVVTINGITSALGSGPGGWTLDGVDAGERDDAAHLSFAFHSSKAPLVVVRSYACVEGSPAIEAWTSFQIRGSSSVTVSNPNVWQLSVPAGTVHFVNGLRGDSAAVRVDEAFMLRDASIGPGASMVLEEHNRSTEQYLPLISADLPTDEFFGGLLWSGSWQMTIRRAGPARQCRPPDDEHRRRRVASARDAARLFRFHAWRPLRRFGRPARLRRPGTPPRPAVSVAGHQQYMVLLRHGDRRTIDDR
jgi:hypothetical protein